MRKIDYYRQVLRDFPEWHKYLMSQSGLPGPRGNLELAHAVAEEGNEQIFLQLLAFDNPGVRENTPEVFIVFCGLVGAGKLLKQGEFHWLKQLKVYSNDHRWRIREAVAIALQTFSRANPEKFLETMENWSHGTLLEQRCVVAALCEPSFLVEDQICRRALKIMADIMHDLSVQTKRKNDNFRILRQTLGYGWSVVIAASPATGKAAFGLWFESNDRDIQWILKANLHKKRLQRLDAQWVEEQLLRLQRSNLSK